MTDVRARAIVLTGMAYPAGAALGAVLGSLSAPRDTQGFADIVWVMLWFIVTGAPVTMLVFWFSTARVDWSWHQRKWAMFGMAKGAFLATGVLLLAIWFGGRTGNGTFVFFVLPVCALIVTQQARRLLRA